MVVLRRPGRRLSAAFALLFFATALRSGLVELVEEGQARSSRHSEEENWDSVLVTRRQLGGPGSSPPTCRARCGSCFPCRPVHVAIQPGLATPLEYYPEAWRCKCGNKLFMP